MRKMNHHRALHPPAQVQMMQHRPNLFSKENRETRPFQQLELEAEREHKQRTGLSVGTGSSCTAAKPGQNSPKSPRS